LVYLIVMAVPRDALSRIVYSSYIYKMYYFTIVIQNSELKDADTEELNILASGLSNYLIGLEKVEI